MGHAEDRAWLEYGHRFRREVLPKLLDSALFISIGTEVGEFDVRQATELGAALLCDKPFLLVVPPGRTVSQRLRRAADQIVEDFDPHSADSQARLAAALDQLT